MDLNLEFIGSFIIAFFMLFAMGKVTDKRNKERYLSLKPESYAYKYEISFVFKNRETQTIKLYSDTKYSNMTEMIEIRNNIIREKSNIILKDGDVVISIDKSSIQMCYMLISFQLKRESKQDINILEKACKIKEKC